MLRLFLDFSFWKQLRHWPKKMGFVFTHLELMLLTSLDWPNKFPRKLFFLPGAAKKNFKIAKLEITLKTAQEKTLHATGKVGLAIQAMKNIGKSHINQIAQARLTRFLVDVPNDEIRTNLKYAPQWIRSIILKITEKKWAKKSTSLMPKKKAVLRGCLFFLR